MLVITVQSNSGKNLSNDSDKNYNLVIVNVKQT